MMEKLLIRCRQPIWNDAICLILTGLMGMPSESSQQTHTSCSYQHSPSSTISTHPHNNQNSITNSHPNNIPNSGSQVPLSHPPHSAHNSPHGQHLSQHGPHTQHSQHPHTAHSQHSQHPQHSQHSQHGQHPSQHQAHGQHTPQQQHQNLSHQPHPAQQQMQCNTGKSLCVCDSSRYLIVSLAFCLEPSAYFLSCWHCPDRPIYSGLF